MSKGLLLLDIDGVLNPYATTPADAATRGYEVLEGSSEWLRGHLFNKNARVMGRKTDGKMLLDLAAETDLELVWATMWNGDANRILAPEIGLPTDLPVIEMDHGDPFFMTAWKFGPIREYARGRPLAWFDDDMQVHGRQLHFFYQSRTEPTFLVDVEPWEGITTAQVDSVREWAKSL